MREGIHLVGLGGEDPLTRFQVTTVQAYRRMREEIDEAVIAGLDDVEVTDGRLDVEDQALKGPSSTWTYLVNDDPFRRQLGRLLTAPGGTTFAIGAAIMAGPFLVLWALVDRFFRRRPR